jgi:hypothetical protein
LINALNKNKNKNQYKFGLLLFSVAFFFGFGEEISWGQRIFDIESPFFSVKIIYKMRLISII